MKGEKNRDNYSPAVTQTVKRLELLITIVLKHDFKISPSDLATNNKWLFLVSIILSVRSRDNFVNLFIKSNIKIINPLLLVKIFHTDKQRFIKIFKPFGFIWKSLLIYQLSVYLLHSVKLSYLIKRVKLKHFGVKIKSVIRNVIFNQPIVAVDTHTRQVFNRFSGLSYTDIQVYKILNHLIFEDIPKYRLHIVMVRFNKKLNFCLKENCKICQKISALFQ